MRPAGRRLLSRPISEGERVRAFWFAVSVLAAAAGLLFALPDGELSRVGKSEPILEVGSAELPAAVNREPRGARIAARQFVGDYLAFVYRGGAAARLRRAASPALVDRLASSRVRVSPAVRGRRPQLVSVDLHSLSPALVAATARIGVGPVAYSIALVVARRSGRWSVTRVGSD